MPFACPRPGSTFRMCRSSVHTSNEQPTPQYVQTVLVFLMYRSRAADSISLTFMMGLRPALASTPLTTSMAASQTGSGMPVNRPASPIMEFSIRALQGQTVTQCPQLTQLLSPMGFPPSHSTRGCSISQPMVRVSFTCTFWQASTQRPHRMHWSGSYR